MAEDKEERKYLVWDSSLGKATNMLATQLCEHFLSQTINNTDYFLGSTVWLLNRPILWIIFAAYIDQLKKQCMRRTVGNALTDEMGGCWYFTGFHLQPSNS